MRSPDDRTDAGSPLVGAHGVHPAGEAAAPGGHGGHENIRPYDGIVPAPMIAFFVSIGRYEAGLQNASAVSAYIRIA
jgi:hypothetical protein